jgi:tRNA modification GTPase
LSTVLHLDETIAAIASALGGGARGIVRVSGPDAVSRVTSSFRTRERDSVMSISNATCFEGEFRLDPPLCDVPVRLAVWPTLRSYTGQPTVEVHTIGSPPILAAILKKLCQNDVRLAEPGEFTLRAFLAGKIDLPQAESVLAVIDARNDRQLRTALRQLAGGLSREFHGLRSQLLNLLADLEAGLDFVDEDIEFVSRARLTSELSEIHQQLDGLCQRIEFRGETSHKHRIALRGRPNTGKSTLWNVLIGHDRAIVSNLAGTTRDYLSADVNINRIECELIDTAGLSPHPHGSSVDSAAQHMACSAFEMAELELLCVDATRELDSWEVSELDAGTAQSDRIVVLTKMDADPCPATIGQMESIGPIKVSAHMGYGLDSLRTAIADFFSMSESRESGAIAATASRCRESLRLAAASIERSIQLSTECHGEELIAAELRAALDELGLIVGATYTDDILDRIFSRFCIGK